MKQAVDKKVDGIAVTLAKPDAMKSDVEAALKAGVPVVALNGGLEDWKKAMGVPRLLRAGREDRRRGGR